MKVFFIGAGPGDPELMTIKGKRILDRADIVIYAGSLVNPALLADLHPQAAVYDSSSMTLEDITGIFSAAKMRNGVIARLHTGDPSLYGAIQEQIDYCQRQGIPVEVIPGVSSFQAAAAALKTELTLPAVSQTVVLSRISGRTKTPESEDLRILAQSKATMVLFLSVEHIESVVSRLLETYEPDTPVAVLYRVSWPDQRICRGTLSDIARKTKDAGISRHALIIVGRVLDSPYEASRLYSSSFSHGFRKAAP